MHSRCLPYSQRSGATTKFLPLMNADDADLERFTTDQHSAAKPQPINHGDTEARRTSEKAKLAEEMQRPLTSSRPGTNLIISNTGNSEERIVITDPQNCDDSMAA